MALGFPAELRQWKETYTFNQADLIRLVRNRHQGQTPGPNVIPPSSMPVGTTRPATDTDIAEDMRSLMGGYGHEFPFGYDDSDDNVPMGKAPLLGSNQKYDVLNTPDVLNYAKLLEGAKEGAQDRNSGLDKLNSREDQSGLFTPNNDPIFCI